MVGCGGWWRKTVRSAPELVRNRFALGVRGKGRDKYLLIEERLRLCSLTRGWSGMSGVKVRERRTRKEEEREARKRS